MMTFLEFTFRSAWHFLGILLLLSSVANFLFKSWSTFWRNRTISKHGYPPSHCDADGSFLSKKEDNE